MEDECKKLEEVNEEKGEIPVANVVVQSRQGWEQESGQNAPPTAN